MSPNRMICEHCGEVIGVYEPLVAVTYGQARETSAAAEPDIASIATERYHRDCYYAVVSPQTD